MIFRPNIHATWPRRRPTSETSFGNFGRISVSHSGLSFAWNDPLHLGAQLTEEEESVARSTRAYAQSELMPRILSANREERFDREIMTEMGALGLLGAMVPERFGGSGLGHVAYGLIAREIERVDSRSEEHTSELQSLMRISYAVFCLKKKTK